MRGQQASGEAENESGIVSQFGKDVLTYGSGCAVRRFISTQFTSVVPGAVAGMTPNHRYIWVCCAKHCAFWLYLSMMHFDRTFATNIQ
jgi:hypothetical protein